MKVMGLERDNTTLPSTPDPRGWRYSASFELYPFHEGKDRAVYKGLLNGQGPKRGWFCVVKAGLDGAGTCDDWRHVQEAVRRAHELAKSFNALVQAPAITFQWPLVAEMEAVSDFTPLVKLFRPHDKKLHKGEMVIIEDFLEGPFQTFSSSVGWVSPDSRTDVTQAFSHYTWHATRELVVCGLQGVACGWGFRLTTPTIHSRCRGRYGQSDGGVAGIAEFFSSHRCNNICCSWPGPDVPDMKKVGGLEGEEGGEERGGRRPQGPLLPSPVHHHHHHRHRHSHHHRLKEPASEKPPAPPAPVERVRAAKRWW
ncbi:uncharacterized protein LOC143285703 [Babylonia areolata]|uniref:uncharacterized protein LOC143285703 n=1 Tax=Babylonia areolata TaxID=304850 RepID=UPI003FCF27E7